MCNSCNILTFAIQDILIGVGTVLILCSYKKIWVGTVKKTHFWVGTVEKKNHPPTKEYSGAQSKVFI